MHLSLWGQRRPSPLAGGGRKLEELGAVWGREGGLPGVTGRGCRSPVPADSAGPER